MAEQADAHASKACDRKIMWVRFPLPALEQERIDMKRREQREIIKWSSNLAYIICLITTDGYVSIDKRHIVFTSIDKQLLETVLLCLKKTNKISINLPNGIGKKIYYRLQIGDVTLYDFLIKTGLFPNKSLTIKKLNIPKKYFSDFLRGHLDGDGSIIFYKDHYNTYLNPKYIYDRLFVYLLSASKNHIKWLQNIIHRLKKIKGSIQERISNTQISKLPTYRLKYSTKEAKIFLNWIYYKNGLPCLLRKYNIAKPFLLFNI